MAWQQNYLENSLKQGDPLSGLIYIMCDEVLHQGYRKKFLSKIPSSFKGYTIIPEKENINQIGHADDTTIVR